MTTQFRNKRILAGSQFDLYRTEPSQQQSTATPPLDMQRAESSHQHVRALNTQFARSIYNISITAISLWSIWSSFLLCVCLYCWRWPNNVMNFVVYVVIYCHHWTTLYLILGKMFLVFWNFRFAYLVCWHRILWNLFNCSFFPLKLYFVEVCLISYVSVLGVNSWVQSQLKNHPDELWEDGVRDYLTHASNIMVISSNC